MDEADSREGPSGISHQMKSASLIIVISKNKAETTLWRSSV